MRAFPKSAFPSDSQRALDGARKFALASEALKGLAENNCGDAVAESLAGEVVAALIEQEQLSDQIVAVLTEQTEEYKLADISERKAHPETAALRNDIKECVDKVPRPAGFFVDTSEVVRFRHRFDCKDHDRKRTSCPSCQPVTCVTVRIGAPLTGVKERVVVVAVEPMGRE